MKAGIEKEAIDCLLRIHTLLNGGSPGVPHYPPEPLTPAGDAILEELQAQASVLWRQLTSPERERLQKLSAELANERVARKRAAVALVDWLKFTAKDGPGADPNFCHVVRFTPAGNMEILERRPMPTGVE